MANSPAHRFGQLIGTFLEETVIRYCAPIAEEYNMYLDYKHPRPARKNQKEVRWIDVNENAHRLDIVIENGGSEEKIGTPRAFIEVAWRRYTKHAKNKVQEISAAISPLLSKYSECSPFFGAVLAGEFTENALNQLRTEGFVLVHFSTDIIERVFAEQGIDVHWEEHTSYRELEKRIGQFEALLPQQLKTIGDRLMGENEAEWRAFKVYLQNALKREVESVFVTALYGDIRSFGSILEARDYILSELEEIAFSADLFYGYEIVIKYTNGDRIEMQFKERQAALASLMRLM